MPLNKKLILACIAVLSITAGCKKDKEPEKVDESKLFKIYNNSGATINLKIYRNSDDFSNDINPAINTRFDNGQFIYLDPTEYDVSKYYFADYYNDDFTTTNWGVIYRPDGLSSISLKINAGGNVTFYRSSYCDARPILLKNNKPSTWKAVDAFSGRTGVRIWDTLSSDKKNYRLECKRDIIKLLRIIGTDSIGITYSVSASAFSQPEGASIFHSELVSINNSANTLIYNYTKPYIGDPKVFNFPGATGTKDTIMIQDPYYMNFYMMVRQQ